jgi:Domain of unknown function (DUF1963)
MMLGAYFMNDGVDERLIAQFREWKRTAWLPVTEAGDGPASASKFSGTPWLIQGEPWPACPRCEKPMALFLQLDLGSLPAELGGALGVGLLQMFYCVSRSECATRGEGCLEPFSPYQLLRRIAPGADGAPRALPAFDHSIPARLITGWEPVEEYPDRSEWPNLGIDLDDDAADALENRLEETSHQNDKLLGWPSWPQYPHYPNCRVCGRELWLIFSLESDQNLRYMFGDDGCGHITGCPDHPDELAFEWWSY